MNALESHLNLELLRYAAGRAIFCPSCDHILDARRSVLMCANDNGPTAILCGDCYDEMRERLSAVEDAAFVRGVDVTDGRSL